MPLHVARLRDSDLAAEESPEACWYAVLLWAASWHQIPAASLPDNDAVLTKLIGLGRDVKTFKKHRAGALRGFVLCADGRLYHPVVAEQAVAAWEGKLHQRWRTECARIKKANQRTGANQPLPTFEEFHDALPAGSRLPHVPRDNEGCPQGHPEVSPGTTGSCPQGKGIQGTETETGTGTGTGISSEANASGAAGAADDLDKAAWSSGVRVLCEQGGLTDANARKFFGRLLSANGLEARDLLPAISGAMVNATQDPQGYLTRSAQGIAKRRAGAPEKRVGFV